MKKILFLGCNFNQIPYLKVLKDKNFYVIGADINLYAPGKIFCNKFYNVGYDDYKSIIEIGKKEDFISSDKVFTASAQFAHYTASLFAEFFKISYPKPEMINFCLDKVSYYKYFLENQIPLPTTFFIKTKKEIIKKMSQYNSSNWFYLKSDFSKNPNYVYRINSKILNSTEIYWGKDRYLRSCYILQEEYPGTSLRLNLYGSRFNVIDFNSGKFTTKYNLELKKFKVIETLKELIHFLGMTNWLMKFDIILNDKGFVVLDIGIDPPSRMLKKSIDNNISFYKYYLDHYLKNEINYPAFLDQ
jgi:hypothetical protein